MATGLEAGEFVPRLVLRYYLILQYSFLSPLPVRCVTNLAGRLRRNVSGL